ncbi:MAG: hypothetical protein CSA62_10415 [Planctomycetota bacterium]|nr:MAG: hypothetical protein CSA62_10415 [Planctomycetota bacterium]
MGLLAQLALPGLVVLGSLSGPCAQGSQRLVRFDNGLELLVESVPACQEMALFLFVKNGWAQDPLDGTGTMHLVDHLVLTGATPERKGWSYQQWQRQRTAANSMTACRYTCYYSIGSRKAISSDARRWAEVLAGKLRFGARDLGRERPRVWTEARKLTTLVPGPMLQWRARQRLLAGRPEGRVGVGLAQSLAKLSEAALREAYLRSHHVGNALLVALGRVDVERDLPFYRQVFAGLKASAREPLPTPTPPKSLEHAPASWAVRQVGGPFATLAFAAPPLGSEEFPAFSVAAAVLRRRAMLSFPRGKTLGQAMFFPGYHSLLDFPEIAFLNWRGEDGGDLLVTQEKLQAWVKQQGRQPVRAAELRFAQRQLRQTLDALPLEKLRAAQLARFPRLLYSLGLSRGLTQMGLLPEGLAARIAALDAKGVEAALQKHFAPERGAALGLRPKQQESKPKQGAKPGGGGR